MGKFCNLKKIPRKLSPIWRKLAQSGHPDNHPKGIDSPYPVTLASNEGRK
jgi:hypothetical protein